MDIALSAIDARWKEAFPEVERPELYTSQEEDEHGFLPINDPQSFAEDTVNLTTKQLYAVSLNNQSVMKQAQDEYLEIESVIRRLSGKDPRRNPQAPQADQEFEDRQESVLYGYKYIGKEPTIRNANVDDVIDLEQRDVQHPQDPFAQGGFVPTAKQYAMKLAKAADKRNPDGWKPIEKAGKLLIPKMQQKHDEYVRHQPWTQEDIDAARAGSDDEQTLTNGTPSKPVDKRLTRTRFDGQKVPPTRDVSEDPTLAPSPRVGRAQTARTTNSRQMTPMTAAEDGSPVPKKRQRLEVNTIATYSRSTTPTPLNFSRPRPRAGQPSAPTGPLSPRSMRNWKWTSESLIEAIKTDYLWLHPDPVKARVNRDKLMMAANPVRTWSMCNKWIEWHEKGLDKRPRNKDGSARGVEGTGLQKLGVETALMERVERQQQGTTEQPASRDADESEKIPMANSASGSIKESDAGARQDGVAVSRKNSAAKIEPMAASPPLHPADGVTSRRGSSSILALVSRKNSVASIKAPSSTRSTRGAKRKYDEADEISADDDDDDEEEEDDSLQSQADRQLLRETVKKEEAADGEFRVRTPRDEVVPSTPTRRSARGRSQVGGS